jgi:hypothetical protein
MVRAATGGILLSAAVCVTASVSACAPHRVPEVAPRSDVSPPTRTFSGQPPVVHGVSYGFPDQRAEFAAAVEERVADLRSRGGVCGELATVLENSLTSGLITLRPYMWRVDGNLASAQGESSGAMTIARDIDSLNVGVRGLDDVLRSAEHEAAHIALQIPSGDPVREARVDERVNSCRGAQRR